ncbi:MAG TPA: ferredoxin [Planctomycetota bacterium]|nr:ferredoxin [Planctomycetota bacterium]
MFTELTPTARRTWRLIQLAVLALGLAIWLALMFRPPVGLHAFWNVLIPVAPALVAVAPGLWRNICPLASTALLPRHLGLSRRIKLSSRGQDLLALFGLAALLLIVPLRHVVLDLNGPATALTIALLAALAVSLGLTFEWKSGWCSGACPVHPVEKLYGTRPALVLDNAHCTSCEHCSDPCPDSTEAMTPLKNNGARLRPYLGTLLVGGFPGYIWGWFQVPDYAGASGWEHTPQAYAWPFGCLAISLAVYLLAGRLLAVNPEQGPDEAGASAGSQRGEFLARLFACAAIACYYYYRLPALFGFGPFPGDGMLVDLREVLPAGFPVLSRVLTSGLCLWWFLLRQRAGGTPRTWSRRPAFSN